MKITKLLAATALSSVVLSSPAYAQDVQEEESFNDNVIIVTASKRETTLQETPIAVSVTSAETIEQAQIRDLLDLQTVVPSLRVNQLQSSANTNFIIRGFGNGANNAGIEPSVGVFIDGVYRSRSAAQIGDLPNIQRVEVLRGPQSTLFGKNASAGVISIVTQKPQFEFGGSAELSYGNYDAIIGKASVTGPLTDTIAFSAAGNINKRDGYARDVNLGIDVNERDRWGVRGQILFEPSNDLSVRIIGDYDKIDENCCVAGNLAGAPSDAILNVLTGGMAISGAPFDFTVRNNFPSSNNIKNYGVSGQIDYAIGALNLTSITAYREVRIDTNQDSDFTSADLIGQNLNDTGINTFTQELRVTSDFDGPLNFLLGGYYFKEDISTRNELLFGSDFRGFIDAGFRVATGGGFNPVTGQFEGGLGAADLEAALGGLDSLAQGMLVDYTGVVGEQGRGISEAFEYDNEAFSIFGQVDFEVTDRLTLTAGFNYTDDSKKVSSNVVSTDIFSSIDLDAPQYAPFRNQLLIVGGLAPFGVDGTDPAAVGAFASNPATAPIFQQIVAFANANDNNPDENPLAGAQDVQFLPPFVNFPNAVEDGRTDDTNFSYTLRANYEVTDNLNIYVTYATGYKAPSFNLSRDSRPFPADLTAINGAGLGVNNLTTGTRFAEAEEAEVYEIGAKVQLDRLGFNIALFDQSLTNFQSNVFTGDAFVLANAGETSVRGFEFDASVEPTDGLTFNAAMTYLDAKYDDFTNSAVGDLTGGRPAGIAEWAITVGATYVRELSEDVTLTLHTDFSHESNVQAADGLPAFIDDDVTPPNFQPARDAASPFRREVNLLNASASIALANGLEFGIWGRNLTNDQFITTIFDTPVQTGSISGYPNQPRTYGGVVRFRF